MVFLWPLFTEMKSCPKMRSEKKRIRRTSSQSKYWTQINWDSCSCLFFCISHLVCQNKAIFNILTGRRRQSVYSKSLQNVWSWLQKQRRYESVNMRVQPIDEAYIDSQPKKAFAKLQTRAQLWKMPSMLWEILRHTIHM